jgi:hypothetical protein
MVPQCYNDQWTVESCIQAPHVRNGSAINAQRSQKVAEMKMVVQRICPYIRIRLSALVHITIVLGMDLDMLKRRELHLQGMNSANEVARPSRLKWKAHDPPELSSQMSSWISPPAAGEEASCAYVCLSISKECIRSRGGF